MPRWLHAVTCFWMAFLVAVICIVPGWHLYPLTFSMEAFVFGVLLLLSGVFLPLVLMFTEGPLSEFIAPFELATSWSYPPLLALRC
jgi:hypothetical protein